MTGSPRTTSGAVRAAKARGGELRDAVPYMLARLLRLPHAGSGVAIEQPDRRDPAQRRPVAR
jgi:hypothetical protein